ncbi:hypothetical protein NP493_159g02111 [Ridgeia piscesae]|uniref:Uncharacterized protein n=1 Tax=Ridgeia piscesae TaxID=27915 RepID=A0AAD9UFQ8_RIDPI|nr:hypothetical protein NP493_159g02111 [Ridgeia piscesae]
MYLMRKSLCSSCSFSWASFSVVSRSIMLPFSPTSAFRVASNWAICTFRAFSRCRHSLSRSRSNALRSTITSVTVSYIIHTQY